jgi:hypothetical protein
VAFVSDSEFQMIAQPFSTLVQGNVVTAGFNLREADSQSLLRFICYGSGSTVVLLRCGVSRIRLRFVLNLQISLEGR